MTALPSGKGSRHTESDHSPDLRVKSGRMIAATTSTGSPIPGLIIIALFYFVPTFVAFFRHHHQRSAILILNLFLGCTGIGWIAALVWSATAVDRRLS